VALPRILVVDDSEAVRETLSIVLGTRAEVRELSPNDCTANFPIPDANPELLIVNGDTAPEVLLRAIARSDRPVVWLRANPALGPPIVQPLRSSVVLPRQFDAHQLNAHVEELLRQPTAAPPRLVTDKLVFPYLPQEAADVAREAASNNLPVLICGEPGTGRSRVAAALHACSPAARFVTLAPPNCTQAAVRRAAEGAQSLTLFVDEIAAITAGAEEVLLELAETHGLMTDHGWLEVRLITATASSLSELASGGLSRDLYYRLSVLPITLPPLRDRPEDIPALAKAIAGDLCSTLGCRPVAFTPRAMQRLSRYLWFGNTAELETVLARTIALVHKEVLDVGDLLFGYGRLTPASPAMTPQVEPASPPLATAAVDLIINELAHEFKNPLVTIKTFAQHLDRLIDEEGGDDQLVRLTGEAVDRMDRALENLLQFTRFEEPAARHLALGALLGPVLAELGPLLSERQLVLDYRPVHAGKMVAVDPEQVSYALLNLLRALIRGLRDGAALTVSCGEAGLITVGLPARDGDLIAKLRNLLSARAPHEDLALPLGITLARSLILRNGGHFDLDDTSTGSSVTIRLPVAAEMGGATREHGTTSNFDR